VWAGRARRGRAGAAVRVQQAEAGAAAYESGWKASVRTSGR